MTKCTGCDGEAGNQQYTIQSPHESSFAPKASPVVRGVKFSFSAKPRGSAKNKGADGSLIECAQSSARDISRVTLKCISVKLALINGVKMRMHSNLLSVLPVVDYNDKLLRLCI